MSRAGLDLSGPPLHEIEIRGKREMLAVRIVERAAELPAAGAVPIRRIELVERLTWPPSTRRSILAVTGLAV